MCRQPREPEPFCRLTTVTKRTPTAREAFEHATGLKCERENAWVPMLIEPNEVEQIIAEGDDGKGWGGRYWAAKLLQEMLAAGLSRYEPDPLGALAEARRRRKTAS